MDRPSAAKSFGDDTWREALKHRGLSASIAIRYCGRGLEKEDLIQVGLIGVCEAVERYRPELGSFSTYASYWIKQSIRRELAHAGRVIHVPLHALTKLNKARRGECLDSFAVAIAGHANAAMGRVGNLEDLHVAPRDRIDLAALAEVRAEIDRLDARERQIIALRYDDGLTLEQVGGRLGITKERVRQICRRALAKIRETLQVA